MFTLSRHTARLLVFVPFAALLGAACEHDVGPAAAVPLLAIAVTPNPATVLPKGTQQFTAVGTDATGAVVSVAPVTWTVVASGGTIGSGSGLFTAGAPVATFANTIRACNSSGSACGFATVIVDSVPAPDFAILGKAATYGIFAATAITCTTAGTITGDVGESPGNSLTGFPPCTQTGGQQLNTAAATQAKADLQAAYNFLSTLPCTNPPISTLDNLVLAPGVYCTPPAGAMGLTGNLTLNGPATGVWVIQIGSSLTTASGSVILTGGAQAKNVWFVLGTGSATIGTAYGMKGNILASASITLNTAATLVPGRALALNAAVTLSGNNNITVP
jgi:ice-binding like protein